MSFLLLDNISYFFNQSNTLPIMFKKIIARLREKAKIKHEAIKKESNQWKFTCEACNKRSSIWEAGGIRYKAKGEPKMRIKCPKCGEKSVCKVTKDKKG